MNAKIVLIACIPAWCLAILTTTSSSLPPDLVWVQKSVISATRAGIKIRTVISKYINHFSIWAKRFKIIVASLTFTWKVSLNAFQISRAVQVS